MSGQSINSIADQSLSQIREQIAMFERRNAKMDHLINEILHECQDTPEQLADAALAVIGLKIKRFKEGGA